MLSKQAGTLLKKLWRVTFGSRCLLATKVSRKSLQCMCVLNEKHHLELSCNGIVLTLR